MLVNRSLKDSRNSFHTFAFDEPGECPLCHYAIKPVLLHSHLLPDGMRWNISETYFCTHCSRAFLSFYQSSEEKITHEGVVCTCTLSLYTGPKKYMEKQFDPHVCALSPQFVKIFNQASEAESSGLDEIAGIGYRKALEFLVKDFCIHQNPDKEENIKKCFLGDCIKNYIDYPKLKTLCEKATWIGNDETHYVRKFEDRDINDLKQFISASVHFVTMELTFEDADSMTRA